MIGCALSHRKCWQKVINQQLPFAIILEDDVTILDNIFNIINVSDFDILLIGCTIGQRRKGIHPAGLFTGLFGYIISLQGAYKALQYQLVNYHIDFALSLNKYININLLYPHVVTTRAKASESTMIDNKSNFLDNIEIINGTSLGWFLSEPLGKIGIFKINLWRIIIFIILLSLL